MSFARHLPSGFGLRRATAADALHVGPLMRSADRAEIEALEGRTVGAFLADMIGGRARIDGPRRTDGALRHRRLRGAAPSCDAVAGDDLDPPA